jgi:hypothetical protein
VFPALQAYAQFAHTSVKQILQYLNRADATNVAQFICKLSQLNPHTGTDFVTGIFQHNGTYMVSSIYDNEAGIASE